MTYGRFESSASWVRACAALVVLALGGCLNVDPPEGVLTCTPATAAVDCPDGWFCRETSCYRTPGEGSDAGMDAGSTDAFVAERDAFELDAPGLDAPRPDAPSVGEDAPSAEPDAPIADDAAVATDTCALLTFYEDGDGDGFGNPMSTMTSCTMPTGYVANNMDCDDACMTCRPGGTEVCDGMRDENCGMGVDEGCSCTTGATRPCPGGISTGACEPGMQTCASGAWSACVGNTDPVAETCNNVDDDCDGMIDDGVTRSCGVDTGRCTTGLETCSAGAFGTCSGIGPGTETCNGMDDDCDGTIDDGVLNTYYRDMDGDTFGNPLLSMTACTAPSGWVSNSMDCNDSCMPCRPGGTEVCDGMLDQDCDGTVDDGCACTDGMMRACPGGISTGECEAGSQTCAGGMWGSCVGRVDAVMETCNNRDDNCDGVIDGLSRPCGMMVGECRMGTDTCTAGTWTCTGAVMPTSETCNGLDDDCDGTTDDGVLRTFYRDGDGDNYAADTAATIMACTAPSMFTERRGDCNDGNATINPGAMELCNGIDEDCDTLIDEGVCPWPTGCRLHIAATGRFYVSCSSSAARDWSGAEAACRMWTHEGRSFRLTRINDTTERDYVSSIMASMDFTTWTSLNDQAVEGSYRWSYDASTMTATSIDWSSDDPGGAAEDCVSLSKDYLYRDHTCSTLWPFVCEQGP